MDEYANMKDIIKGSWKEVKGKIKQQWAKITDDEILKMEGSSDELEGALQRKYGCTKEEARGQINDFIRKHNFNKNK